MVWACNFCQYRNADNNINCVVCRTARETIVPNDMSRISGRIADAPLPAPAPVAAPAPKEAGVKRKSPEKRKVPDAVPVAKQPVAAVAAVAKPVSKPVVAAKQPVAAVAAVAKPVSKPVVAAKQRDDAMDVDEKNERKVDDTIWCWDCQHRVKNRRYTEARHMCNNKYCKSVTANNGPVWVCDIHFNENHKHIFGNPDAPPAGGGFGGFGGGGFGGGGFGGFGGGGFGGFGGGKNPAAFGDFVFPKR